MKLLSSAGRVIRKAIGWLRSHRRQEAPPVARPTAPVEPKPRVPAVYLPLYTYLDGRYASTVVLTFAQIEALLGFTPPPPAFEDAQWWVGPSAAGDRHTAAWTAAHRTAAPQLGARIVVFERLQ